MGIHYKFQNTENQKIDDVGRQLEKVMRVMRNCNQGSYATRYRHAAAMSRFIKWLVPTYGVQKISNVNDKHLISYGKYLIEACKSHKYIKDELSGIRFVHRHTPNCRNELGDGEMINRQIGLHSTPNGICDRKWTSHEFKAMVARAYETDNEKIALMMEFALRFGARLDETASMRRHILEMALKSNLLKLENTKGGRVRYVPIYAEDHEFITRCITGVARGEYVFCPKDKSVHQLKKHTQEFIGKNRSTIQDTDRRKTAHGVHNHERGALSFHGLRHSFSRIEYERLIAELKNDRQARKELSQRLGHSRIDITKTYLGI